MHDPETVVDALRLLRAEGYEIEFQLVDGHLRCDADDRACPASDAVVEHLYRFEGASDPGDEMVVFGLRDPVTGRRGVLASAYGLAADPDLLDHLVGLSARFTSADPAPAADASAADASASRDLSDLRETYQRAGLRRASLADDPVDQFARWWDEWRATDPYDAAACVLATVDASGQPSARWLLCRSFDADGVVVYTNQQSRKARDLATTPKAAVTFGWLELARQVRVEGSVSMVDDATADAYWASRPRGSQIGAWASAQSEPVSGRDELDAAQAAIEARFGTDEADGPIPRPPHWGGYRVSLERVEFWQGQPNRLHDRFEYRPDGATWQIRRLSP